MSRAGKKRKQRLAAEAVRQLKTLFTEPSYEPYIGVDLGAGEFHGVITVNEARAALHLPPLEGGDKTLRQWSEAMDEPEDSR